LGIPQSFTTRDTEVIMRARRKRRAVLVLREDSDWLREFHPRPKDLLLRMASRGALIKLGAGRYAIPTLGSDVAAYNAWQPMLHGRLAPLGDYYLGFFSALEEHRLTDLSEPFTTVLVGFASRQLMSGKLEVAGRPLRAARTRRLVFKSDLGVEVVRLSRTERYLRSNPTRTLVDCLWHPQLSGATETWVSAWGRGMREERLDPLAACRYALALGPTVARRTGLMLDLLGAGEVARAELPGRVRRSDRAPLMLADGPAGNEQMELDPFWRVRMNVSRDRLEGWLSYGK
jgi:predicted transcriptional regulator of viral defense system